MIDKKVIIYGYTTVGEAVYQECKRRNWEVICFCDDSRIKKNNALYRDKILTLEEIIEKKINAYFIIAIPNYKLIIQKLKKNNINNWIIAYDILLIENYKNDKYLLKSKNIAIREIEACLLEQKYLTKEDKLYIRNLDLVITEKCSLKCQDCSNLMQYYINPQNFEVKKLLQWVDMLFQFVDDLYEMRIIGGEPLMHISMHKIIEELVRNPKIHFITIYTNGTIMPTEKAWNTLVKEKVGFSITDYGKLSYNLENIKREMDYREISYDIHTMGGWTQCSEIIKHGRSIEELKKLYEECCVKNLLTLLDGKIYKCPYMANAVNLKAVPRNTGDYLILEDLSRLETIKAKQSFKEYMQKEFFYSCDYCNGRIYDAPEIEPAIQIKRPKKYKIIED